MVVFGSFRPSAFNCSPVFIPFWPHRTRSLLLCRPILFISSQSQSFLILLFCLICWQFGVDVLPCSHCFFSCLRFNSTLFTTPPPNQFVHLRVIRQPRIHSILVALLFPSLFGNLKIWKPRFPRCQHAWQIFPSETRRRRRRREGEGCALVGQLHFDDRLYGVLVRTFFSCHSVCDRVLHVFWHSPSFTLMTSWKEFLILFLIRRLVYMFSFTPGIGVTQTRTHTHMHLNLIFFSHPPPPPSILSDVDSGFLLSHVRLLLILSFLTSVYFFYPLQVHRPSVSYNTFLPRNLSLLFCGRFFEKQHSRLLIIMTVIIIIVAMSSARGRCVCVYGDVYLPSISFLHLGCP